jgi:hypothetical protein
MRQFFADLHASLFNAASLSGMVEEKGDAGTDVSQTLLHNILDGLVLINSINEDDSLNSSGEFKPSNSEILLQQTQSLVKREFTALPNEVKCVGKSCVSVQRHKSEVVDQPVRISHVIYSTIRVVHEQLFGSMASVERAMYEMSEQNFTLFKSWLLDEMYADPPPTESVYDVLVGVHAYSINDALLHTAEGKRVLMYLLTLARDDFSRLKSHIQHFKKVYTKILTLHF